MFPRAYRTSVFVSLFLFSVAPLAAANRPVHREPAPLPWRGWLQARPATGQCSIQLTHVGCRACCETSSRLSGFLVPLCDAATRGSGGILGGWLGAIAGGLVGDLICEPMMQDTDCYDRCIGKDGDPTPINCADTGDPDEFGVCRQVCEQGQHNIGPGDCPTTQIGLTCCVGEFDECPISLCPGAACPPECDEVLP